MNSDDGVLAEGVSAQASRDEQIAAWLMKKAREYRSTGSLHHRLQAETIELMADKIRQGAVR